MRLSLSEFLILLLIAMIVAVISISGLFYIIELAHAYLKFQ